MDIASFFSEGESEWSGLAELEIEKHLEIMVGKSEWVLVQTRIILANSGGSSRVFSSAFCACWVRFSASSMVTVFDKSLDGWVCKNTLICLTSSMPIFLVSENSCKWSVESVDGKIRPDFCKSARLWSIDWSLVIKIMAWCVDCM